MGIAADFVLIVIAGLLGGMLARAMRLPLLVGYVLAGIAVGPHTAGPTVGQIHDVETLAEIGVALLLFSIGLEVSFRDLQAVRRVALAGGSIQVLLTLAAGAVAATYVLQVPVSEGIWFGGMIAVSSTMVVLKVLAEKGVMSSFPSRVMIGLLLVQDLAVIPMLIVLPQLGNPENLASRLLVSVAVAGALLAAIYLVGTLLLPPLLRRILAWGSRELFLVAVVAVGVGVGAATFAAGYSFAIGAFVAGLILSESEFSHQALSDVVPLRDIFGLLFFVTVGMLFDPQYALSHMVLIAAAVLLTMFGKSIILGGITRAFGYRDAAPWIVGLGLSQIGEFSFVLARTGLNSGALSKPVYDLTLTTTIITMAISPLVSGLARPLSRRLRGRRSLAVQGIVQTSDAQPPSGHVIVAGYGRTGRAVAQALRESGTPFLIVESNYSLLADLQQHGFQGLWGDIARDEIQQAAGVSQAKMLMLTMPDQNTVNLALARSRRLNPDLILIARSTRAQQLPHLRSLGVTAAVQPEFEGGLEMVRQGLIRSGHPGDDIVRIVDRLRTELYEIKQDLTHS